MIIPETKELVVSVHRNRPFRRVQAKPYGTVDVDRQRIARPSPSPESLNPSERRYKGTIVDVWV